MNWCRLENWFQSSLTYCLAVFGTFLRFSSLLLDNLGSYSPYSTFFIEACMNCSRQILHNIPLTKYLKQPKALFLILTNFLYEEANQRLASAASYQKNIFKNHRPHYVIMLISVLFLRADT